MTGSSFYFSALMITITPIIMGIIFIVGFWILKIIRKNSIVTYSRQVAVSIIMILYSLHPTITRLVTSLYFCMELDSGEYWLQKDLSVRCWEGQHLDFSLMIGLPSIIIWVFGVPFLGFIYFWRKRSVLDNPSMFGKYRMIY